MRALAVWIALVVPALGARASAQAPDLVGFGARGAALGGAVSGDVQGGAANYYNPAGIVRGDRVALEFGYFRTIGEFEINGYDSGIDSVSGLLVGAAIPGEIGPLRFAFGVGLHLPDGRVSRSRTLPREQPRWEFYDNRPHRAYIAANVAIRPLDWLLIGGGIGFQARSANELTLRGELHALAPETSTFLEHEANVSLRTLRFPIAGIQILPHERVSIGLAYRGQIGILNDLDAAVRGSITGVGEPIPAFLSIETEAVNVFMPHQLSLGVTVDPLDELRIGVELTWVRWSDYRSAIGASDVVLDLDVPPALAGIIRVPDMIASTRMVPAEFEDRIVPRLGIEATPLRNDDVTLQGRFGYVFESTPVPEQRQLTNLVDNDRHAFSLGAGVRFTDLAPFIAGALTLDLEAQLSIIPERLTEKSTLVTTIGDYRASGMLWNGMVTAGVEL
jgi:long-chain fatty acid transport protein